MRQPRRHEGHTLLRRVSASRAVAAVAVAGLALVAAGCSTETDQGTGDPVEQAEVRIVGFTFEPPDVSVLVGGTVTWTNEDTATHTVTSDDQRFDSGGMAPGDSYEHAFDTPGVFAYRCTIHPSMNGTVTVVE